MFSTIAKAATWQHTLSDLLLNSLVVCSAVAADTVAVLLQTAMHEVFKEATCQHTWSDLLFIFP